LLAALAFDIKDHGQREAITLFEGKVLDGWNRVEACRRAGFHEVVCKIFKGNKADALAFVWSMNRLRRHLTDQQRAAIAVEFSSRSQQGARTDLPPIGGKSPKGKSKPEAAEDMKVSLRSVERLAALNPKSSNQCEPRSLEDTRAAIQSGFRSG
jgi:hypothetical protein